MGKTTTNKQRVGFSLLKLEVTISGSKFSKILTGLPQIVTAQLKVIRLDFTIR